MKNHFLPRFFVFIAIIFLFALLLSQRGLSALAADSMQVETETVTPTMTVSVTATPVKTATPTITPTPSCDLLMPGSFVVSGGDDLLFTVTNPYPHAVYLTNTTLNWTDYYDPNMYIDYFDFAGVQYWAGDGFSSPSTRSSNVAFPGNSVQSWDLDFDGYGNLYNVTHTIGPFNVELTFNNSCVVMASIPPVVAKIINPVEHQIISFHQSQTKFEAKSWDTGVGTNNGDGIERIHMVLLDPNGVVISSGNRQDTSVPYCMWGNQSPCPQMPNDLWNTLPNGIYTMIVWGKSSVTASWSPPHTVQFKILRTLPRPTLTPTPAP